MTDVPQRWIVGSIRIERVHAVVLGGHKEYVLLSFAGNLQRWNKQRLGVHRAVNFEPTQSAELFYVDVLWSQNTLAQRGASTLVVVLRSSDLRDRTDSSKGKRKRGAADRGQLHSANSGVNEFAV